MGPTLLIASPQMKDPFFERAVVLVWHHDLRGAMGAVVNRTMPHSLPDVLDPPEDIDLDPYADTMVAWGGPVETASGTVLTRREIPEDDGWNVRGIGVTRSMELLHTLLREGEPLMLILGYSGWGPGQLDEEIKSGSWILTDCDSDLIFDAPIDARYDLALATLGLSATTVWMQPIDE